MSTLAAEKLAIQGGTPVSKSPIPFMLPALHPQDIDAAHKVLQSGILRAAKKCEELETRIAQASAAKHAMTCANGTCALQLAYEPLFNRGDEILCPSWTFIATVNMLVARGCKPIFVDAHPETGQFDVADAAKRITKNTRGIAATHMYGCPVDIDGVQALAAKHNLKIVYDAAQAILATYKNQGIGKFGDAVTYSFYATKNLGTGEGGMITCNDDALARQIKLLRSHGETDKYLHEQVGYNYRMNDVAGAIGCSRMERLQQETEARRAAANTYANMFASMPAIKPLGITPGAISAYHLYTVRVDLKQIRTTRDEFCKALNAEGVPTAVHYPRPLTRQPAFKDHVGGQAPWPVAESLCQSVFCLPMHHGLTSDHFGLIGEALNKVLGAMRA